MRLLLDTHVVLWWFQGNPRMTMAARAAIDSEGSAVFVSPISAFEIAFKHRMGKLPEASALAGNFELMTAEQNFQQLPLTSSHAITAGDLTISHRDPFDRLLIAQALVEDLTLISNERLFDTAGVTRLW
ncbi:MAG TPA: type II toxin-antitoxin system VapC family toxin [Caulobacteraceae bacterium]|nr:type II toxin-antitoxin system VapC family toxin [Caulobacteraceae bacterium]